MAEAVPTNGTTTTCYIASQLRKLDEGIFTWDLMLPDSGELLVSPLEVLCLPYIYVFLYWSFKLG